MSYTPPRPSVVAQDLGDANFKSDIGAHAPEAPPLFDLDTPRTIPTKQIQPQSYFFDQRLVQCEKKWHERNIKLREEIEDKWYARLSELNMERREDSAHIGRLTVEYSLPIFQLVLTLIQAMALREKTENIKLLSNYNICGALGK